MAPWAFAGLVAVAAPVLVHWLARQQADRLAFPTLQFLVRTPPVSVRRHRLRDLPLLLVRVLIVVSAVAALAQPVWVRPAAPAARPARAIVVDTSASLGRALADGRVGRDVAREAAAAFAAEAGEPPAMVIPAEQLADGV
ncbi:MAG TPA: BatA domain-containing protein, partial [Vicinamibacterales bacterium]|nr:BatA domain-containing protein [Vicinamibacterales bacterium]